MTPTEYLDLAIELAESSGPASLRSAVDRAYYAAFLAARGDLSNKGYLRAARNSQAHSQVADALRRIAKDSGDLLFELRRSRNRVTYQTGRVTLPRGQSIADLLDSARAVITAVQALPAP